MTAGQGDWLTARPASQVQASSAAQEDAVWQRYAENHGLPVSTYNPLTAEPTDTLIGPGAA